MGKGKQYIQLVKKPSSRLKSKILQLYIFSNQSAIKFSIILGPIILIFNFEIFSDISLIIIQILEKNNNSTNVFYLEDIMGTIFNH